MIEKKNKKQTYIKEFGLHFLNQIFTRRARWYEVDNR